MDKHRTTVYLDPPIYRAMRLKAAETNTNISALVNIALRAALADDLSDLRALDERSGEPARPFEDFLKALEDDGLL